MYNLLVKNFLVSKNLVQLSDPKVRSLKFMLRCSGNHYLYSEFDDEDAVDKLVLSQYHMIKGK